MLGDDAHLSGDHVEGGIIQRLQEQAGIEHLGTLGGIERLGQVDGERAAELEHGDGIQVGPFRSSNPAAAPDSRRNSDSVKDSESLAGLSFARKLAHPRRFGGQPARSSSPG